VAQKKKGLTTLCHPHCKGHTVHNDDDDCEHVPVSQSLAIVAVVVALVFALLCCWAIIHSFIHRSFLVVQRASSSGLDARLFKQFAL
jgi:hypothetical protein